MKTALIASSITLAGDMCLAFTISPAFTGRSPLAGSAGSAAMETLLAKGATELQSLRSSVDRLATDRDGLRQDVRRLEARVSAMERSPGGGTPALGPAGSSAPATAEAAEVAPPAAPGGADGDGSPGAEFESLFQQVMNSPRGRPIPAEDRNRLVELARTTDLLPALIGKLEKKVEKDPEDIDAKMELSNAYLVKLMSVDLVEQGAWAVKAEGQWNAVLKLDPEHWEAQYSLASCWSHYPDFLNKTPDAIRAFERVLEIQEKVPVQPEHAATYVNLSRLYAKAGDAVKSREVLERGARLHPSDEAIGKALTALGN